MVVPAPGSATATSAFSIEPVVVTPKETLPRHTNHARAHTATYKGVSTDTFFLNCHRKPLPVERRPPGSRRAYQASRVTVTLHDNIVPSLNQDSVTPLPRVVVRCRPAAAKSTTPASTVGSGSSPPWPSATASSTIDSTASTARGRSHHTHNTILFNMCHSEGGCRGGVGRAWGAATCCQTAVCSCSSLMSTQRVCNQRETGCCTQRTGTSATTLP